MTSLLQQFLVAHGTLPLPGFGVLHAEYNAANYDVTNQSFEPGSSTIVFDSTDTSSDLPSQEVVGYLAQKLDVPEEEAFDLWMRYISNLKNGLSQNRRFQWMPLGDFHLDSVEGSIHFITANPPFKVAPLPAERVVREGASHAITVGDTETTNIEMQAYFTEEPPRTSSWWWWPLGIALAALAAIAFKKLGLG